MAYIRAAQDGNFSSPSTWVGGVVPSTGDYACTLTNRITLDIDTGANICVNQTDWVAAGGTANSSFTGGFTIPAGDTRTLGGSFRYDGSGLGTGTTSAIYMTGGSLTINGGIDYIDGYYPTDTTLRHIIYVNPSSASAISLIVNGSIEYKTGTTNNNGLYHRTLIYVNGFSGGMVNLTLSNLTPFSQDTTQMQVLNLNGTTGYNLIVNGSLVNCGSMPYGSMLAVNCGTTGLANQNIVFNGTVFGATTGGSVYAAMSVSSVYNVTFTNGITINNGNGATTLFYIGGIRGELRVNGDITTTTSGRSFLDCNGTGSVTITGNIYLNYSSVNSTSQLLNVSGTLSFSCGNIILNSSTILTNSTYSISLPTSSNISIGNISFISGGYIQKPVVSTSNRNGTTTIAGIDCRNMYLSSASALSIVNVSGQITNSFSINGDIYGSNNGSAFDSDTTALYFQSTNSTQYPITINGNIYTGLRTSCLKFVAGGYFTATVNGTAYGSTVSSSSVRDTTYAVINPSSVLNVNSVEQGLDGKFPILGKFRLNNSSSRYLKIYDTSNDLYTLNAQPIGVIPSSSDVRKGTSVGVSVGTLNVPNPSFVMKDVSVDNTVGTLNAFNEVSKLLSQISTGQFSKYTRDQYWENVTFHVDVTDDGYIETSGSNSGIIFSNITVENSSTKIRDKRVIKFNSPNSSIQSSGATGNILDGSYDFTIEFFMKPLALPTSGNVHMLYSAHGYLNIEIRDTGGIGIWSRRNNSYWYTDLPLFTVGGVYHFAFVRNGSFFSLYINGTRVLYNNATTTNLIGLYDTQSFGRDNTSNRFYNGYMSDITVTQGVARYSGATITVPTVPYPYNKEDTITSSSPLTTLLSNINSKTSQLTFSTNGVVADAGATGGSGGTVDLSPVQSVVDAIKIKTDQLSFSGARVLSDPNLTIVDYTSRFNTIDSTISSVGTKVDSIKSKTDDLSFYNGKVLSKDQDAESDLSNIISTISGLEITAEGVKIDGMQDIKERINTTNFILSE